VDLTTLRDDIAASTPQDWHRVEAGPQYRDRFTTSTYYDDDRKRVEVEVSWHHDLMVLRADIDVSIAWGMDVDIDPKERDLRVEGWAKLLDLDEPPRLFFADIFYRGALVDRVVLCSVDYGDGCVPLPDVSGVADELQPETEGRRYRYTATPWELGVARLIHDTAFLLGGKSFDSYIERAQMGPPDDLPPI
jgi:hypothetical protein